MEVLDKLDCEVMSTVMVNSCSFGYLVLVIHGIELMVLSSGLRILHCM